MYQFSLFKLQFFPELSGISHFLEWNIGPNCMCFGWHQSYMATFYFIIIYYRPPVNVWMFWRRSCTWQNMFSLLHQGKWRATELQELHITYGYRKSYENQLAWLLVILLIAILNYLILSILLQGPKIGRAFERLEGDFSFHVYRFLYYSGILSNSNRLYQSHKIETNILRLRI